MHEAREIFRKYPRFFPVYLVMDELSEYGIDVLTGGQQRLERVEFQ